ncbi:hypothetical protein A2963_02165 [Candidatus Roizmanbacteria bacterium RIFCSPLOWO2_01_FULL_40_13]|nr:MAG: hypothetical protein A2963_02165 [Candidatus Roizmanbacteria bacterium RIFCSPLOWO2_01_FULL_40_13]
MRTKKALTVIGLLLLVGFNFYHFRSEFTVLIDPNDNIFQYALVDEAKNIWKEIFAGRLSPFYLLDSWNERWAEGFALTSYYSHLPQAVISLIGLISPIGMYKAFVVIRTLTLIFLPLMFFFGAKILGVNRLTSYLVALFSQAVITDGLYGIDISSFLWRGWGLSAQLMAVFFLPVAFAYAIDYLENKKNLGKAILFNFLLAQSHIGIFLLLLLGYALYFFVGLLYNLRQARLTWFRAPDLVFRILLFIGLTLFSLSYFIVPFFFQGEYRNFSVWDPIWKFDSWGLRQIIVWFLNGDLFDFGRFPVISLAVIFGLFAGLGGYGRDEADGSNEANGRERKLFFYLSCLFIFYFILFAGRTTLGGPIDIIPGFSEFHQHRIIVMVQFAGILLGAWFAHKSIVVILNLFQDLLSKNQILKSVQHDSRANSNVFILLSVIALFVIYYLEQPLIKYSKDNAVWIERSNKAYLKDLPHYEAIKAKLTSLPPARIYVGRPGNWGKQFTVGETPLYMASSQDGYPTIGFLPQSWSPNSDPEQFFNEQDVNFYHLYNVGYSILPDDIKPPEFAKLIVKEGKYNLYRIESDGWFTTGQSSIAVKSDKINLLNMTRLWFESDLFKRGEYPMIDIGTDSPDGKRWYIEMTDKNNWINLNDGLERNIWQANPFAGGISVISNQATPTAIVLQEMLVNGYRAHVKAEKDCSNCIVVLKQSFHPNWQVKVNGKKVKTIPVFPFYIGIPLGKNGSYEILAEYKPGRLKTFLLLLEIGAAGLLMIWYFTRKNIRNKSKLSKG